jgi:hypothetical protein
LHSNEKPAIAATKEELVVNTTDAKLALNTASWQNVPMRIGTWLLFKICLNLLL